MSSYTIDIKKINNCTVNPIPEYHKKVDTRPILGASYFPELYSNIFLCAKKKSGKTTVIYNIIKKCVNKHTKIVAFVSTIDKDKSWANIKQFCKTHDIEFMGYTSTFGEHGENTLETIIHELQKIAELERIEEEKKALEDEMPKDLIAFFADTDDCKEEEQQKKERKPKYQSPEYLFIFDDISDELRKNKAIASFVKKHRHFKAKCIFSSQYAKDLDPQSLKQMDYILIFKGENEEKLKHLYDNADLPISFEEFQTLYHKAVNDHPFSFLYIDRTQNKFRIGFDQEIKINQN